MSQSDLIVHYKFALSLLSTIFVICITIISHKTLRLIS